MKNIYTDCLKWIEKKYWKWYFTKHPQKVIPIYLRWIYSDKEYISAKKKHSDNVVTFQIEKTERRRFKVTSEECAIIKTPFIYQIKKGKIVGCMHPDFDFKRDLPPGEYVQLSSGIYRKDVILGKR